MHVANGGHQLGRRSLLRDISRAAGVEGFSNVIPAQLHGDKNELRSWTYRPNLTCGFDSVEKRHGYIEQDDVRPDRFGQRNQLTPIRGGTYNYALVFDYPFQRSQRWALSATSTPATACDTSELSASLRVYSLIHFGKG